MAAPISEHLTTVVKRRYREDPKRVAERNRAWRAANRKHVYAQRKRLSREIRQQLIEQLGGCCVECGSDRRLEFDHIFGTTWDHSKMSGYDRVRRYKAEADEGLIQLLCKRCNQRKGRPKVAQAPAPETGELPLFEVPVDTSGIDAPF